MNSSAQESGVLMVDISKQRTDNRQFWQYKWSKNARKMYWPELTEKIQTSIEKCIGYIKCFKTLYIIIALALLTPAIIIIINTGLKDDESNQRAKMLMITFSVWCLTLPFWGCAFKKCWIDQMQKLILQMNDKTMRQGYMMQYQEIGCCYTRFMILFFAIENRTFKNVNYSMM